MLLVLEYTVSFHHVLDRGRDSLPPLFAERREDVGFRVRFFEEREGRMLVRARVPQHGFAPRTAGGGVLFPHACSVEPLFQYTGKFVEFVT